MEQRLQQHDLYSVEDCSIALAAAASLQDDMTSQKASSTSKQGWQRVSKGSSKRSLATFSELCNALCFKRDKPFSSASRRAVQPYPATNKLDSSFWEEVRRSIAREELESV